MKKKNVGLRFLRGAWLLTAVALLSKLMGAFYRIPLTRALGARGMGMYQSVFPTYALIVTITSGGLAAAVSKLVAQQDGEVNFSAFAKAAAATSLPITVAAAVFAPLIASLSGSPEAVSALLVLLPSVPLSAVCAVMRGYFQGTANVRPSAVGQLIEQAAKLGVGLTLSFLLAKYSLTAAVAGCAAGVTFAEAATALYYFLVSKRAVRINEKNKENSVTDIAVSTDAETVAAGDISAVALTEAAAELAPSASDLAAVSTQPEAMAQSVRRSRLPEFIAAVKSVAFKLIAISFPITLGLIVVPLCQVADSFVVANLLTASGTAQDTATSLYGMITGPVNSLVNMPAVLTVGLCATLLPKVSQMRRRGENIGSTVMRAVLFAALAGATAFVTLSVGAELVLKVLYGSSLGMAVSDAAQLLKISAFAVPFTAVLQTASSVLQGADKSYVAVVNLFVAAVIKETLNFILIPRIGIVGFAVSNVIFFAVACVADLVALLTVVHREKGRENPRNK